MLNETKSHKAGKKILFFCCLIISIATTAQNDAAEDTTASPLITSVGKPDGRKTEIKITKEESRLKSSDGMLELIIPVGAVPQKTIISIQPITNTMSNGNGPAYRLEPSGIRFQKPVRLIFHYDEEEIKDSLQLLLGIAMQDEKGQWLNLNKTDLDTVVKTISGNINHFSDWSNFTQLKITPSYARVKVNKTKELQITNVSASPPSTGDDAELSPLTRRNIPWGTIWTANAIVNGNAREGKITAHSKTYISYKAPAALPPRNPVEVAVQLTGVTGQARDRGRLITLRTLLLVSNILIYDDAYEVTMISEVIDPGMGSNLGSVVYRDTGSFVVSLNGSQARLIEKVNKNMPAGLNYSGGCCYNYTILKTGHGNIHIAGTPVIKVIPSLASGKPATVEISFSPVPSIFPLFQVTCQCPGEKSPTTSTNAKGIVMMAGMLSAQPIYIKFEAKEGEQTILKHGQPGGQLYTKFTVKQIKEE